ncbi:kelch-like protein 13 [Patiria miniata]|uniref:BTB domain-containing protein n=1 Tax=Patiria miniata TaxID=46514 RepID=A0A914ARL5_PATMI|nr:kelch-like protein 13 [Patiria miniata]
MDGAESDGSENYYSATEQTQPTVTADHAEKLPARRRGIAKETRGSKSPSIGEDLRGSEDRKNKTAQKKRHRERRNSETTTDSPLINHALNGMNTLYVLWANKKLCDVIVVVGGDEFPAHGVVLATHSDYFLRLLLRKQSGAAVITPNRIVLGSLVSASGFRRILRYMYTAELELTWVTVCEILQVASALKVTRIVELGQEFLQNYTIENCLGAMLVASRANLTSLATRIRRFVLGNFLAVSRTKEYLQCPVEVIADLLADDNVSVSSELEVLGAAKTWIHANGEAGLRGAPLVMRQVRFQQVSLDELAKHIETDEALMQIPEVRSRVIAVHIQRSSIASTGTNASLTGSMLGKTPTKKDQVSSESAHLSCERLQMPLQNMTVEDLKEAKIIDQSTTSSLPSSSNVSRLRINDRHVTESNRYLHITSSETPVWPLTSDIEQRIKDARIIDQSTPLSNQPTLTPLDSSQPISERNTIQSSPQQPKASKTSSAWAKPLYSEADKSKEATIIQSSSTTSQQVTPRQSLRPISGYNVNGESSVAPSTVKTLTSPGNFSARFHAPRLASDYRITASNPKALTGGPIAWPVTTLLARRQKSDVIVTVGGVAKDGESETAGRMVQAFLLDKNEWRELERMPSARNHHVVHCLNGFLYVVGGSDPHTEGEDFLKPVSSVLKYDVRAGKWSEAHPMNAARIFHEVTALFGQLYVVGGQDQEGRTLATVECYSPNADRWHYVAPLPSARYGVAVTVYRGRLWVAGGYPEEQMAETSTVPADVICYNPFRNE